MVPSSTSVFYAVVTEASRPGVPNEDAWGVFDVEGDGALLVIADGSGGPELGELAASLAVAGMDEYVRKHDDLPVADRLHGAFLYINDLLLHEARFQQRSQMGAAVILAHLVRGQLSFGWLGGAHAFILRRGDVLFRNQGQHRNLPVFLRPFFHRL